MKIRILALLLGIISTAAALQDSPELEKGPLASLIDALGDADPGVRARVHEVLRKRGADIEPALRENLGHSDAEIAARCRDLVEELEQKRAADRRTVVGRVIYVDPKFNFICIGIGKSGGFKPGDGFEILREPPGGGGNRNRILCVARAEFEKFMGMDSMSKLRILEGNATDVRTDDLAAKLRLPSPEPLDIPAGKGKEPPPAATGKIALVDEKSGKIAIDLRERDGAKVGDHLDVIREGRKIGTLSITDVHAWGSWVKPRGETKLADLQKGDRVDLAGKD